MRNGERNEKKEQSKEQRKRPEIIRNGEFFHGVIVIESLSENLDAFVTQCVI